MRSRLMVRFHLRQLNCRGFPLSVLNHDPCISCIFHQYNAQEPGFIARINKKYRYTAAVCP